MNNLRTKRLTAVDRDLAGMLFAMMANVFEEEYETLSDSYLERLLGRADFWAIAGFIGADVVGGLTAHILPMTRTERAELFIFDIAVRKDQQRRGVGGQLMKALIECAAAVGIHDVFVAADNDDLHALDFYRALGGVAAPVTLFTFSSREGRVKDPKSVGAC
ncbi:MAG TPA: GNAT family N-acetyltransferase [Polyangiaceae bacterium]|nr:GNAT family N-acetyltransferase [Polyangiaceae bacterium]